MNPRLGARLITAAIAVVTCVLIVVGHVEWPTIIDSAIGAIAITAVAPARNR